MAGATDWVRRALAEMGPDATVKEVTDFIVAKDQTVPRGDIPLALRKLRKRAFYGKRAFPEETTGLKPVARHTSFFKNNEGPRRRLG